ncbi:MAG: hypothetical protein SGCHY_003733 [Lobulomycetales sp.]
MDKPGKRTGQQLVLQAFALAAFFKSHLFLRHPLESANLFLCQTPPGKGSSSITLIALLYMIMSYVSSYLHNHRRKLKSSRPWTALALLLTLEEALLLTVRIASPRLSLTKISGTRAASRGECCVCLQEDGDLQTFCHNKHYSHVDCMRAWIRAGGSSCPFCRGELVLLVYTDFWGTLVDGLLPRTVVTAISSILSLILDY